MNADLLKTLHCLEEDLRGYVGKSGSVPDVLEQRRFALLSNYLGYVPSSPLPLQYVIGDSHSAFFAGTERLVSQKGRRVFTGFFRARYVSVYPELLPVFRIFHLGAATAWQAGWKGSSNGTYEKINVLLRKGDIPKGAGILLVFGEIDIRCHIPKAILSGGHTLEEAVNSTVERFLKLPLEFRKRGYCPAIWLPSLNAKAPPTEEKEDVSVLPIVGDQSLRDEITHLYCSTLKKKAADNGFKTSGLPADILIPENERYMDAVHLSQSLMPEVLTVLIADGILPITPA